MSTSLLRTLLVLSAMSGIASAQCGVWTPFASPSGVSSDVYAFAVYDDGSGPALYAGGQFASAGTVLAAHIARWNGVSWSAVGGGTDAAVNALAVYDDGSGPALYAGGEFTSAGGLSANHLAKWNGTSWSADTGMNNIVRALCVYDDGSGPKLYAGGDFTQASTTAANHIASWNGSAWSALGSGVDASVGALEVYDDGSGSALFVGGSFSFAGGASAHSIAKWNGSAWSPLFSGTNGVVHALAVYDGGSGPELCVGGQFTLAGAVGANHIAKWNGGSWSPLGSGMPHSASDAVWALTVFDEGTGPALCAGGSFLYAGVAMVHNIARWHGSTWSEFGGGVDAPPVYAIAMHDDGAGPALFAGGSFTSADGVAEDHIAKWRNSGWSPVGGPAGTLNGAVRSLKGFDDGTGPALYGIGAFTKAGSATLNHIGRWNGTVWSPLGTGLTGGIGTTGVYALEVFDDGTGPALYAAGNFNNAGGVGVGNIAKWNGVSWSALTSSLPWQVDALAVYDDGSGPRLYAGGFYWPGQTLFARIGRWDGSSWSDLGGVTGSSVTALRVYDDGSGPALYATGNFSSIGGVAADDIAKWNGSTWAAIPIGAHSGSLSAMRVFDDGTGPALYVSGSIPTTAGPIANPIAKWDGTSWSAVGGGVSPGYAASLTVFDDGSGPALFVSGSFSDVGGTPANNVAKWNGTAWSALGRGVGSIAYALAAFDDGVDADADLFVGGTFIAAGGMPSYYMAKWHGCGTTSFCFGDGSVAACPCANTGATGRGCNNSAATGGATLSASGAASLTADTVHLISAGELPSSLSIALQGSSVIAPVAFGDGLRCAGGTLKRLYSHNASAGALTVPQGADPSISVRSSALGDPIPLGAKRAYQFYYRDPNLGFCPGGFNATNAVSILWIL